MKIYDATKLSYAKFHEAVRVNGAMVYEVHNATASAIGVVVPSTGGAVLIPWHAVRWAVEADVPAVVADVRRRAIDGQEMPSDDEIAAGIAAFLQGSDGQIVPSEKPKPKRKRGKASE